MGRDGVAVAHDKVASAEPAFTRTDGTSGLSREITADVLGASVRYGTVHTTKTAQQQ